MNNTKKVYRYCKGEWPGIGPYGYLMHKMYEKEGLSEEDVKPLKELLISKERWANTPLNETIKDKLNRIPVFEQKGCFSTYKAQRPGVWDDPVLKHNLYLKGFDREKLSKYQCGKSFFAFDSVEQLNNWFNDMDELKLLNKFGFNLQVQRVNAKDVFFGLKQVWVVENLTPKPIAV
jgi:hypothetical protein